MTYVFYGATAFNLLLGTLDTSSTESTESRNGMFHGATRFNQPLAIWDTSLVMVTKLCVDNFVHAGICYLALNQITEIKH